MTTECGSPLPSLAADSAPTCPNLQAARREAAYRARRDVPRPFSPARRALHLGVAAPVPPAPARPPGNPPGEINPMEGAPGGKKARHKVKDRGGDACRRDRSPPPPPPPPPPPSGRRGIRV